MRWMWIDTIVAHEPAQRLVAIKQVSLAEEHLHDHFAAEPDANPPRDAAPIMPMSLIIEGMAQTAGILVGSVNRFTEKVILAKIVRAEIDCDVTAGQSLQYTATLDRIDSAGAATSGDVSLRGAQPDASWRSIGTIDLMFSHVDQNMAGLEFPEENFVFSNNFRTIVRAAGMDF